MYFYYIRMIQCISINTVILRCVIIFAMTALIIHGASIGLLPHHFPAPWKRSSWVLSCHPDKSSQFLNVTTVIVLSIFKILLILKMKQIIIKYKKYVYEPWE